MKRFVLVATTVLLAAGASNAAEIRNNITSSVQLKVDPTVTLTTDTAGSYGVSGTNIDVTTLGRVSSAGVYDIQTNGSAFSFSETTLTAGQTTTVQTGGTAAGLAGTLTTGNGGSLTVTAGGSGTQAIGQTSIELSVFQ
jgi:hypothetical protein